MRIVFTLFSLWAGGAERVTSRLANELAQRGHDISIVTKVPASTDFYALHPKVLRTHIVDQRHRSVIRRVIAAFHRSRSIRTAILDVSPDVVISLMSKWNLRVAVALLGDNTPLIVSERVDPIAEPLGFPWNLLRRLIYPRVSKLVLVSAAMEKSFGWVHESKRIVLENPVSKGMYTPRTWAARDDSIVAMGRFVHQKGFDLLIEALAPVLKEHSSWTLTILGDGPQRERLKALIAAEGLEDRVNLPGIVPNPEDWLVTAKMFVLSSRYEGYPNALLEALASGATCVAFACPTGPDEILIHGETGYLVEPESLDGLTSACRNVIERPSEAAAVAARGLKRSEDFHIHRIVDKWETLLTSVSSG